MKEKLKALLATPKGKLAAAGIFMCLALLFMLVNLSSGGMADFFSGEAGVNALRAEIQNAKKRHSTLLARESELKRQDKLYAAIAENASRDQDAAEQLRSTVAAAAQTSGVTLNSIGSARTTSLGDDLTLIEIDLNGSGSPETVVELLLALEAAETPAAWRKLELRTGGRGPMAGQMQLSGTVGAVQYTPKEK